MAARSGQFLFLLALVVSSAHVQGIRVAEDSNATSSTEIVPLVIGAVVIGTAALYGAAKVYTGTQEAGHWKSFDDEQRWVVEHVLNVSKAGGHITGQEFKDHHTDNDGNTEFFDLPPTCNKQKNDEYCFGFQGTACFKINEAEGLHSGRDTCPPGQQMVSVGSLAHDTCCLYCKEGTMCGNPHAPGMPQSLSQTVPDTYPCNMEWRKATYDALHRHGWCMEQPSYASDTGDVLTAAVRYYDVYGENEVKRGRRALPGTKSTFSKCAPRGTGVDCIGCESCGGSGNPCAHGIGDSDFCCEKGKFTKVEAHNMLGDTKLGVGLCA